HALVGGVSSVLSGGKFGHGFIAAGFTKMAMGNAGFNMNNRTLPAVAGRTAVAAIVGGTASAITGGKFSNGARTAAMMHLLNAEGRRIKQSTPQEKIIANLKKSTLQLEASVTIAVGDYGTKLAIGLSIDETGVLGHASVTGFDEGSGVFVAVEAGATPGIDTDNFIPADDTTGSSVSKLEKLAAALGVGGSAEFGHARDGASFSGGKINAGLGYMDMKGTTYTGFLRIW
ncbi:hypothetical protein, partial [Pseudoalteromonas sp. OOF1S-7]|uniref:hypothetical protein n=1 Tax=Pseudoalteromonas sp. OOF1S-7 TaxID=2917757 RepID=UPI001EF5A981